MPNLDHILMIKDSNIIKFIRSERIIATHILKVFSRVERLNVLGKRLDMYAIFIYVNMENNIVNVANSNILTALNFKAPSQTKKLAFP